MAAATHSTASPATTSSPAARAPTICRAAAAATPPITPIPAAASPSPWPTASLNTGIAAGDSYNSIENLTGSNHDDILNGSAGGADNLIRGSAGNDWLKGYSGNDWLYGGSGNDVLDGGLDGDWLYGDSGNDTVTYENAGAGVTVSLANAALNSGEAAGDSYFSIENLRGSNHNDILNGTNGNNLIQGLAGDDLIKGYRGWDRLQGGGGDDTFIFASTLGSGNLARIDDFSPSHDMIRLYDEIFTRFSPGGIAAANFRVNHTGQAQDANDYLIYNSSNGYLYYDADGSGAGGRAYFAALDPGLALTASQFEVV